MTRSTRFQPSYLVLPTLVAATVTFGLPGSASAQGCTGAPGASAIQQYCEAIPSAGGGSDRPGGSGGSGLGGSSGSGVSAATSKTLSEAGADGAAVDRLAGGSAERQPKAAATPKSKSKSGGATGAAGSSSTGSDSADDGAVLAERVEGPADPDGSPLKAATKAVANGPTAGAGLVWSLAGFSAIGVGAAIFLRRRGDSLVIDDDES